MARGTICWTTTTRIGAHGDRKKARKGSLIGQSTCPRITNMCVWEKKFLKVSAETVKVWRAMIKSGHGFLNTISEKFTLVQKNLEKTTYSIVLLCVFYCWTVLSCRIRKRRRERGSAQSSLWSTSTKLNKIKGRRPLACQPSNHGDSSQWLRRAGL